MIVVRLQGGLGNQMFQYAAARALAERIGGPIRFDGTFMDTDPGGRYTARKLELTQLNVNVDMANERELSAARPGSWWRRFLAGQKFIRVTDSKTDLRRFFSVSGNVYLDGYFQSELFFKDVRKKLLDRFRIKDSTVLNREHEQMVGSGNTVAVHVRRGDYVSLPAASQFHGVLGMDYYDAALGEIRSKTEQPKIFVFSDDIGWCRAAFKDKGVDAFIDGSGKPSAHDLMLMSKCAHQVLANSSYSWWAAWLNQNPGKIVIAPERWYLGKGPDALPIVLPEWIKV